VPNRLKAISPLDGRYSDSLDELTEYFSELALMRYRLKVEIEYLIALGSEATIKDLPHFSKVEKSILRKIYRNFNISSAQKVKLIEEKTNHDVKAIEYYIQTKTRKSLHPWIHFALTSEDVNNLSYSLIWNDGLKKVYLPTLKNVKKSLMLLANKYKNSSMLSLTHGQPATPTTFGKELAVFASRLDRQIKQFKQHLLLGKLNGATGTWSAHNIAYPKVNWIRFSKKFIKSLGLEANLITTQIEPHDSIVESYHQLIRVNSILKDLCQDIWAYISRGILSQKKIAGEIGSSVMPHKINPIQFENAEGNLGLSNALLNHLSEKLSVSRMQRDLSDSTTLRNQGVMLGHSYLALKNILKGLNRIAVNKNYMKHELNNHWEVLAEAIQTILRKAGHQNAYEELKKLTRGQQVNADALTEFVSRLDISENDKKTILELSPQSYVGLAPDLIKLI
tara:strand:+ start:21045 stop:22394 length:1350 start_codon:yes stop_codon:yes gene_type:complete